MYINNNIQQWGCTLVLVARLQHGFVSVCFSGNSGWRMENASVNKLKWLERGGGVNS